MLRATLDGATDGAWPAVAPAISGLNGKLGGGGDVKGNPVSNRGTAQCAKSRWGAHSSTWCRLPWGSGHVKVRSTRAHTRGHWWTRPGSKARVATAARTPMAGPSRSRGNWSWETLPINMKGRSGTLGEQNTLNKGLTDVGRSTTPSKNHVIARIKNITQRGRRVVPCRAIIRAMTRHQALGWGQATPRYYIIMDTIMRMGGHITLGGHGRTIPGRSCERCEGAEEFTASFTLKGELNEWLCGYIYG